MNALDLKLFYWLNSWAGGPPAGGWADTLIIFRSEYLPWAVGILAVLIFIWPRRGSLIRANSSIALEVFASALVARFGVAEIIRYFYNRPRPFEVLENVHQLVKHETGGSFPSGHAAFFFALAATIFLYRRGGGILFFLAAFAIGTGRISAGLHWPSDILGGAVVGILTSILVNYLFRRYHPRISEKAE